MRIEASGGTTDLEQVRHEISKGDGGPTSLLDLKEAALKLGYASKAVKWKKGQAVSFPVAAILHLRPRSSQSSPHFVVATGSIAGFVQIIDFPHAPKWLSSDELWHWWDGYCLYIAPNPVDFDSVKAVNSTMRHRVLFLFVVCLFMFITVIVGRIWSTRRAVDVVGVCIIVAIALSSLAFAVSTSTCPSGMAAQKPQVPLLAVNPTRNVIQVDRLALAKMDGSATARFQISNKGSTAARLLGVYSGCSCAEVELECSEVRPGETCEVVLSISMNAETQKTVDAFLHFENALPTLVELHAEIHVED